MSSVDFYFEGQNLTIQCNRYDKMKQIFQNFYSKAGVSPNSVTFLYNGRDITNEGSTFYQLANIDDKNRNKMNILVTNIPNNSSSQFFFERGDQVDDSMKDFAKMVILFSMNEYPDDDDAKANLIVNKFQERYKRRWSCCLYKKDLGGAFFNSFGFFFWIRYDNYDIVIAKTHE